MVRVEFDRGSHLQLVCGKGSGQIEKCLDRQQAGHQGTLPRRETIGMNNKERQTCFGQRGLCGIVLPLRPRPSCRSRSCLPQALH